MLLNVSVKRNGHLTERWLLRHREFPTVEDCCFWAAHAFKSGSVVRVFDRYNHVYTEVRVTGNGEYIPTAYE